jgi:molybdate/tungstate transport system substrate-binding protein
VQVLVLLLALAAGASPARAQTAQVTVCHAGSLQAAFADIEREFTARHAGGRVNDVSGGSVALAGRMAAGAQPCDVFAAADYLDIDLLLKPLGLADYTIVFAKGRMVLAYLATDPLTAGIAAPGEFKPPASIPKAAPAWYRTILQAGVRLAGSHPFLDPAGYRAHMIFELAETYYGVPNLYHQLLEHYTIIPAVGGSGAAGRTLGDGFDFQFIYEHSAAAAAAANPAYRYVTLPDRIDLSTSLNHDYYARAAVAMPGIGQRDHSSTVSVPAARVAWGLTIPKGRSSEAATAFVATVLGTAGTAALTTHGPAPVTPAYVSRADAGRLPRELQALVQAGDSPP